MYESIRVGSGASDATRPQNRPETKTGKETKGISMGSALEPGSAGVESAVANRLPASGQRYPCTAVPSVSNLSFKAEQFDRSQALAALGGTAAEILRLSPLHLVLPIPFPVPSISPSHLHHPHPHRQACIPSIAYCADRALSVEAQMSASINYAQVPNSSALASSHRPSPVTAS